MHLFVGHAAQWSSISLNQGSRVQQRPETSKIQGPHTVSLIHNERPDFSSMLHRTPPTAYLACTSMGKASPGGAPSAGGGGAPSAGAAGAAAALGSMGLPSGPISMTIACAWRKLGLVTIYLLLRLGVVLYCCGKLWRAAGLYAYEQLVVSSSAYSPGPSLQSCSVAARDSRC